MPLKVFILWDTLYAWLLKRQRSIGAGSILSGTERVELGFRFGSIASSTVIPDSIVV
jgi:hypothetical protein